MMRTAVFKIRPEFIDPIKNGTKRHEYRLNKGDRALLERGDHLFLIANDNSGAFAEAEIVERHTFSTWEEALSDFWSVDFKSIFSSFEEALDTCRQFYSEEDMKTFGLVVFSIRPLPSPTLSKGRVLVDARFLENSSDGSAMSLLKRLRSRGCYIAVDRASSHTDGFPADTSASEDGFDAYFGQATRGLAEDETKSLYQIYSRKYDYYLTENRNLQLKAGSLFSGERILNAKKAQEHCDRLFVPIQYDVLKVVKKKFGELDIDDPFFNSLKEDYPGFSQWFAKKADSEAYVFYDSVKKLNAFLYLKIEGWDEDYSDISPVFPPARRMKVGTFKIQSSEGHFRLSERFFKAIFDNAIKEDVDSIYVTLFEGRRDEVDVLRKNLEKWGFFRWGEKSNGESVYVKDLRRYSCEKSIMQNFPLYSKKRPYYWLPIQSHYHDRLFPDSSPNGVSRPDHDLNLGSLYALEKIYLTRVDWNFPPNGSHILIYRMGDTNPKRFSSLVTGECILNWIRKAKSRDELNDLSKNKSVFSEKEINESWEKGYCVVVSLLYLNRLEGAIRLADLCKKGIIPEGTGPRVLERVEDEGAIECLLARRRS